MDILNMSTNPAFANLGSILTNSLSSYLWFGLNLFLVVLVFWGVLFLIRKGYNHFQSLSFFGTKTTEKSKHKEKEQSNLKTTGNQEVVRVLYLKK